MTEVPLSTEYAEPPGRIARLWQSVRRQFTDPWRSALISFAGVTIAEATTTLVEPRLGMALHGLVLIGLFLQASLLDRGQQRGFFLSMALAPLIRLLSLSLPLPSFPFMYWYAVVGAPLLLAAYAASRIGKVSRQMQGFALRRVPIQILIALSGIGLGYLEYLILRPAPLVAELRLELIWAPALILLIFTGFLEEWIFRGLMQYTAMRSFGRLGFYYVAAVFAVLHLGYRSVLDVLFVFGVAVFFGWAVQRTGSISGVTIAHGLTNIGLFLVFPFLVTVQEVTLPTIPEAPPVVVPLETSTGLPQSTATLVPTATSTPVQLAPGLLGPVPTREAARPWVPPTATPLPPTATQTLTLTPLPTQTQTYMPTGTATPTPTDTLILPTSTVCGPPAGWTTYVVRWGDTLGSLSRRLGVSVEQLRIANCLTSNVIYAGQTLYVPFLPQISTASPAASQTPPPTATAVPTQTSTPLPPVITLLPTSTRPWFPPTYTLTPTTAPTATLVPTLTSTPTPPPTDTPLPTETLTPVPSETPTLIPTLPPSPTSTVTPPPPTTATVSTEATEAAPPEPTVFD